MLESLNICCDIYHKNDKTGRLEIKDTKLVKNEVYTDNVLIHPFPRSTDLISILEVIESRVLCESRCDKAMLNHMGLEEYNIYDIFRHTHGVDSDDFIWFKFDEDRDDLCWDDVKVRG